MLIAQNFSNLEGQIAPKFANKNIADIVNSLLPYIFTVAGLVMLLYVLYGGYNLMTSGGDPKAIQEAKGKLTNAVIGFIIIFLSYWIVQIIGKMLGLEGFQGSF